MNATWEKIFAYASMPVHGSLSRKLRKGVAMQVNEGDTFENAVLFLGEKFVRITQKQDGEVTNCYFDWQAIHSMKTISPKDEK